MWVLAAAGWRVSDTERKKPREKKKEIFSERGGRGSTESDVAGGGGVPQRDDEIILDLGLEGAILLVLCDLPSLHR